MNDITPTELAAALTALYPDIATWWTNAANLPTNTTSAEFLAKTMHGAFRAATTKNASLAAGTKIAAYPAPQNGAVTLDTSGNSSYLASYTVQARVAVDLDTAFAPNA